MINFMVTLHFTVHAVYVSTYICLFFGSLYFFLIQGICVVSENGLLSYENPNYHLDPARLDDALNSNTAADLYEELYQELDAVCNLSSAQSGGGKQQAPAPGRRSYASLDIGSMGVDITTGPVTNLDSQKYTDNRRYALFFPYFSPKTLFYTNT